MDSYCLQSLRVRHLHKAKLSSCTYYTQPWADHTDITWASWHPQITGNSNVCSKSLCRLIIKYTYQCFTLLALCEGNLLMTGGFFSLKAINFEGFPLYGCHNGGVVVVVSFYRISADTWYGNDFRIYDPLWGETTRMQHHRKGRTVIWNTLCSFHWIKSCGRDLFMFYVKCLTVLSVNKWLPTSLIHHAICVNTRRRVNQSLNNSIALWCQTMYFWWANRSAKSHVA